MAKTDSDLDNRGGPSGPQAPARGGPGGNKRLIKSTVRVGKTPVTGKAAGYKPDPNVAGAGILSRTVTADPRLEYVASGGYLWLNHFLRSLPWYIDDIERDFGNDIYDRMLFDPAVSAAFKTLKTAVLREGVTIHAAEDLRDPQAQKPPSFAGKRPRQSSPLAIEIADFCRRNIENMKRPLESLLFEMLDGAAYGNKVAEMIFNEATVDPISGRIVQTLKVLKTKPRTSTAFVVDAYANVVGLLGLIPGQGYPVIVQGLLGKPGDVPNMLPREKFAIFVWQPRDEDPRGTSCLRPAYTPWWFKQQNLGERLKFIVRFATPSVAGFVAPEAAPVPMTDGMGNPLYGTNGQPIVLTAQQAMQTALLGLQNGTAGCFAYGSLIQLLEAKGEGQAFKTFQDDCDRDINRAILLQTLASGEAEHQSRSSSETHQDILELPVAYGKQMLADMIAHDICRLIITTNYGEEFLPLTPVVSLGDVESHNFAEMAPALADLGYTLDPSQYEAIDSDMALPQRAAGWMERQAANPNPQPRPQPRDRDSRKEKPDAKP